MPIKKRWGELTILSAIVLAIGFMMAGYFIGKGFYKSRMANRYVTVKGLSERNVKADLAVWQINFTATGDLLAAVQEKIDNDRMIVLNFLKRSGLQDDEYSPGQLSVTDVFASSYRPRDTVGGRFIIKASVPIRSNKINLIASINEKIGELVSKGVVLADNLGPSYFFTKLNEVKPAMIAEATSNARKAAEQFAKDSGSLVSGIRRANQGVFRILPRYGKHEYKEDTQIDKRLRVVSTIEYYLEN